MPVEIQIPISELKSVLPGFTKIIGRSSTLPVLQCLKVSLDQGSQVIALQAHNLDEIATVRLPSQASGSSGEVLVPLDILTKIVKGCGADQSIRLLSSKDETRIRYPVAGSFVDRLVTHIPSKEWPEVKLIPQEPIALDDAFKTALKEALECASEDSSRYVLNGACLDVRQKDAHYIVASDGRHLYSANSFAFGLPESLIIPSRKFVVWPGFISDGPWHLRMLPGIKADPKQKESKDEAPWLQIESERWTYVTRGIDGQYPSWKQAVPTETANWTKIILAPEAIETILDAIPLLPGNDEINRPMCLAAGNGLALRARGRDQDVWTTIDIPGASVTGKAVDTTLNRGFLVQALRFGLNRIEIEDSLSPLVFTAAGKTMIVMPMRHEGPVQPAPATATVPSQTENTSAAPPSPAVVENQTDERNNMSSTTITAPERGNLRPGSNNGQGEAEENRSAFKGALETIEKIRTNLRDLTGDLTDAISMLKAAEKQQRGTSKEVEAIRSKLREIQSVKL